MLRYGVKFYVSIMAASIIFRADVLIVNRFRGAAEAGVYAVASQFSFLLLMLPGVIATLLFPRVASSPDQTGEFAVRLTRHTTMIMLILCTGAVALSFVLPLIYGAPFADATVQLLMLFTGNLLHGGWNRCWCNTSPVQDYRARFPSSGSSRSSSTSDSTWWWCLRSGGEAPP